LLLSPLGRDPCGNLEFDAAQFDRCAHLEFDAAQFGGRIKNDLLRSLSFEG
jgi:hypothetical protein